MTTLDQLLDAAPYDVDRITTDARKVRFRRVALTLLALLPFLAGWTAGKAVWLLAGSLFVAGWSAAQLWRGSCWCGVAVKAGWVEARKP